MGLVPVDMGDRILEKTFSVGEVNGITPFRMVILENVATPFLGNANRPPVVYPTLVHTDEEMVIGVVTDPVSINAGKTGLNVIDEGKAVNVRLMGTVPVMSDTTTTATNIVAGGIVKSSAAVAGAMCKATYTAANVPDADQHILGVALTKVDTNSRYGLVRIQPANF